MKKIKQTHRVLIVGGGFAGIRTAKDLARQNKTNIDITLVSDKTHFEYLPSLYKVVNGHSPLEICIPLETIFKQENVEIVQDKIVSFDFKKQIAFGGSQSKYHYDSVILAMGSQTAYFNLPGLKEYAFGMKSINEALRLKRHLHELFSQASKSHTEGQNDPIHVVIVGGGPTGVELSGALAVYTRELAVNHKIKPNRIIIDLVDAAERLLPNLNEKTSIIAKKRLSKLGVNIFLNTKVEKSLPQGVELTQLKLKTKTLIWTAGVIPGELFIQTKQLPKDKRERIKVGLDLTVSEQNNVYVIGDGASTIYGGYAQTAVYDGSFVAKVINSQVSQSRQTPFYQPKKSFTILPIGRKWAVAELGQLTVKGYFGYLIRRIADLKFFFSILPMNLALSVYFEGDRLTETCPDCIKAMGIDSSSESDMI